MRDHVDIASTLDEALPAHGGPALLTEAQIAAVAGGSYASNESDPIYYAVGYYRSAGAGGVFRDLWWQLMN